MKKKPKGILKQKVVEDKQIDHLSNPPFEEAKKYESRNILQEFQE